MTTYETYGRGDKVAFFTVIILILSAIMAISGLAKIAQEAPSMGGSYQNPPPLLPPKCDEFRQGCQVERASDNDRVIVRIKSGDSTIADAELAHVDGLLEIQEVRNAVSARPELLSTELAGGRGWIGHIQTARFLRNNGFGRSAWQLADAELRAAHPNAIRVVSDAAGWFEPLYESLEPWQRIYAENMIYIYYP